MRFGKPQIKDSLMKLLTCQKVTGGATVTKTNVDGKPTVENYNEAFEDSSRKRDSAFWWGMLYYIGRVRDLLRLGHFTDNNNIDNFYHKTGAPVLTVIDHQKSKRVLRRGLPQTEFVNRLRTKSGRLKLDVNSSKIWKS